MNFINQYKGLRRENYVLFFGRMVTNLGSMIWPIMTLILNQKMNMSATQSAVVIVLAGLMLIPVSLVGGRLADKHSKKHIIIYCDIVSVITYCICAAMPLSYWSIGLIVVSAACQSMEHPAYNALIADITCTRDRERAYSLQYLGSNIGLMAAPVIAGLLFQDYLWLSFLISGIAIGISTVLIAIFVENTTPVLEDEEMLSYQKAREGESLLSVLMRNRVVLLFIVVSGLYTAAYQQYAYLMPLDLGRIHKDQGALIYGSVSSLNCIVVVIFTPIFTRIFRKLVHTRKNLLGEIMLLIGYMVFLLNRGRIPFYYVAIVLFTFGEILTTISNGPYITARIPESHRGRINGLMSVVQTLLQGVFLLLVGVLYDLVGSDGTWYFVISMLGLAIIGGIAVIIWDQKIFGEIYKKHKLHQEG